MKTMSRDTLTLPHSDRLFRLRTKGSRSRSNLKGEIRVPYRGFIHFEHIDSEVFDLWHLREDGFEITQSILEVARVVVRPRYRSCGHGKDLVQCLIHWARLQQYDFLLLGTWPLDDQGYNRLDPTTEMFRQNTERLRKLYSGLGFVPVHEQDNYRMKLELS